MIWKGNNMKKSFLIGVVTLISANVFGAEANKFKSSVFSKPVVSFAQIYGNDNYAPELSLDTFSSTLKYSGPTRDLEDTRSTQKASLFAALKLSNSAVRIGLSSSFNNTEVEYEASSQKTKETGNVLTPFIQADVAKNISVGAGLNFHTIKQQGFSNSFKAQNPEISAVYHNKSIEAGLKVSESVTFENPTISEINVTPRNYIAHTRAALSDALKVGGLIEFTEFSQVRNDHNLGDAVRTTLTGELDLSSKLKLGSSLSYKDINRINGQRVNQNSAVNIGLGGEVDYQLSKKLSLGGALEADRSTFKDSQDKDADILNFATSIRGSYTF